MTTTVTQALTNLDKHRILADLWTVPGLGEHLANVEVSGYDRASAQVASRGDRTRVAALQVAASLLDGVTFEIHDYQDYTALYVLGAYRGVATLFYAGFHEEESRRLLTTTPAEHVLATLAVQVRGRMEDDIQGGGA
ncbi:MAG TPA: hypothetical protein VFX16_09550 [Pseudonocardiaceae bacterium]|nr:hypothetical protein [Pseudonocardiaceae bacterium]